MSSISVKFTETKPLLYRLKIITGGDHLESGWLCWIPLAFDWDRIWGLFKSEVDFSYRLCPNSDILSVVWFFTPLTVKLPLKGHGEKKKYSEKVSRETRSGSWKSFSGFVY